MVEVYFWDRDRVLYVTDQAAEVNLKICQQPCDIFLSIVAPVLFDEPVFGQVDISKEGVISSRIDADDWNFACIRGLDRTFQVFCGCAAEMLKEYQVVS